MTDGFLLGVIAMGSFTAALFFLKFWRRTRDTFFLAFALSFFVEAGNRIAAIFLEKPNQASPWVYIIRMLSVLLIVVAILRKNIGTNRGKGNPRDRSNRVS